MAADLNQWEPDRCDWPAVNRRAKAWEVTALDSAGLDGLDVSESWLINGLVAEGLPFVIGGPVKSLKTSVAIDLVLSLGSGRPFLNHFQVPGRRRAMLFSGESGAQTVKETARRISKAKGIRLADADCHWSMDLPQLSRVADVEALTRHLSRHQISVAVIDPLYLCLLAGAKGLDASNVYDMGPLLKSVAAPLQAAGVTVGLVHHTTKGTADRHEPLELSDLAFSGIGEFARQWLLVSRRKKYECDGRHNLFLAAGGSTGQGGLWAVDVDEGVLREDFSGRCWQVSVSKATGARAAKSADREQNKKDRAARDEQAKADAKAKGGRAADSKDDGTLLQLIEKHANAEGVAGYQHMKELSGMNTGRMTRAADRLAERGVIAEADYVASIGSRTKRTCRGLRLLKPQAAEPKSASGLRVSSSVNLPDLPDHADQIPIVRPVGPDGPEGPTNRTQKHPDSLPL
jgi:hypothetical protein